MVSSGLYTQDQCQKTETNGKKARTRLRPEHIETVTTTGSFGFCDEDQDWDITSLTPQNSHSNYNLLYELTLAFM